jgi:hypothetical protein
VEAIYARFYFPEITRSFCLENYFLEKRTLSCLIITGLPMQHHPYPYRSNCTTSSWTWPPRNPYENFKVQANLSWKSPPFDEPFLSHNIIHLLSLLQTGNLPHLQKDKPVSPRSYDSMTVILMFIQGLFPHSAFMTLMMQNDLNR